LALQGSGLPVAAIFNQGTPEQVATWVPACYGTPREPAVGAFCVTEPDAGSDVSSMKTRAVRSNGDWVINGRKIFITNGGIAGEHSRSSVALKTFETTRPVVGAQALGIARAAFEFALQYARERRQFGRPIIENQAIAFKLADMATEIEAARGLIWRALWESRNGAEFKKAEGSMAKLKAGEVAVKVTEEAIQICGGYGYIREFPVVKWHRDAKIYTLFEGTSEIQRLVISRALSA